MKQYFKTAEEVLRSQNVTKAGHTTAQAEELLKSNGKNKLAEAKKKTLLARFFEQLTDPMIIVLVGAALVSGIFGEIADMIIILVVVLLNGILGVVQEGKAEKAIEALQKMSSPYSKVRRDGQVLQVKSEDLVAGDIILLEAGDAVPADMRLIESASLKIEEASLTGESLPVEKSADVLEDKGADIPLGDRTNMAYMGSNVVYGRGEGVLTATGMDTEMGKIAGILSGASNEKTPLQQKLAQLSKILSVAVLGICIFIFAFGVAKNGGLHGGHVLELFMTAVSLAVAAIPEGLVAVVTIVLSIGVTKMSKRNSIIRRLTAVETLGCTQVICSDKTGTLTQNKMTVVKIFGHNEQLAIAMALCNDARLSPEGSVAGEPTESALVAYALTQKHNKNALEESLPRVGEAPFDSVRKMMSTLHTSPVGGFIQYTKGAPDEVLTHCSHILIEGEVQPLTQEKIQEIAAANSAMAADALRVLAAASREYTAMPADLSPEKLEQGLTFIGLTGMIDPIRPEVKSAIDQCRRAGIRPIMITGDHKDTAVAIGKELGIITDESQAITGAELEHLSDEEFAEFILKCSVYARVQPEHKVRIVNTWKKKGRVTAMTGDGVNDAPALKSADIGVGMGITGTDVTKNVADIVLADDNFASIVYAVEEGRRIYDNIRKAIQFLLASNLSEVVALFSATLFSVQLFEPIHILWINLITDTLPAVALGMEPAEADIMDKPPRPAKEGIFADGLGGSILYQGFIIAGLTLAAYFIGAAQNHTIAMTMAFLTLSMCEIFHSLNMRSRIQSLFTIKKQNKFLWGAMGAALLLTLGVIYLPGLNSLFKLATLPAGDFLLSIGLALCIIPIVELIKLVQRAAGRAKK